MFIFVISLQILIANYFYCIYQLGSDYFNCRKRKPDQLAEDIANRLAKVSKQIESTLVDHKAYLRADAEAKNLKMAKYRAQVMKEMTENDESDASVPKLNIYCGKITLEFSHLT